MKFSYPISFSNFRSINESFQIPFGKKITLLAGQNNSGKSNILRFLSILFNKNFQTINDDVDFCDQNNKKIKLNLSVDRDFFAEKLQRHPNALNRLASAKFDRIDLNANLTKDGIELVFTDQIQGLFSAPYFSSSDFLSDFGRSAGFEENVGNFLRILDFKEKFFGTVLVPNIRFISSIGAEPPLFTPLNYAGSIISFSTVVTELGNMDRPNFNSRHLRSRLEEICDFVAHCLECRSVKLQVPRDNSAIFVNIDGNEQPLSNLGTGVEQLIIIGLASHIFPEKLVLIDEPELHFHPRAQKRLMNYLHDSVNAQFVIATHSAAILDSVDADLIQIECDGLKTSGRSLRNNTDKYRAVRDLGHSPSELLQSNFVIWVEGPSDRIYVNHWISLLDDKLVEGIDYSIVFYGGRVLAQHSFADDGADLVNAVSLAREFAVIIDSDKKTAEATVNDTKLRVISEVEKLRGFIWLTKGREIENYLPRHVVESVAMEMSGAHVPDNEFAQVLDSEKVKKTDFARRSAEIRTDEWPLDLHEKMTSLVERIRQAA